MRAGAVGCNGWERDMVVVSRRWERGRLARNAALARADTLILAFSHKGRRDPLVAIRTWFRVSGLIATLWIPAFAGMTV